MLARSCRRSSGPPLGRSGTLITRLAPSDCATRDTRSFFLVRRIVKLRDSVIASTDHDPHLALARLASQAVQKPPQLAECRRVQDIRAHVRRDEHRVVEDQFATASIVSPNLASRRERGGNDRRPTPAGPPTPSRLTNWISFSVNAGNEEGDLKRTCWRSCTQLLSEVIHASSLAFLYRKSTLLSPQRAGAHTRLRHWGSGGQPLKMFAK